MQRHLRIKPMYAAIALAVLIGGGISANAILAFVYLGLGEKVVGN